MTAFEDWLAAQARRREDAGLTRRLVPRHPSEPMHRPRRQRLPRPVPAPAGGRGRGRRRRGVRRRGRRLAARHRHPARSTRSSSDALADFTGFPTALVFSTGYHANLSAVSALADADTLVVSDAHVHASLIDACRLSRARCRSCRTTTSPPCEAALAEPDADAGTRAGRDDLLRPRRRRARRRRWPRSARRTTRSWSPTRRTRSASPASAGAACCTRPVSPTAPTSSPPLTLSKSLGAQGGAVLSSPPCASTWSTARGPFIYDTGLAPAAAGGALAALGGRRGRAGTGGRGCNEIAARAGRGLRRRPARRCRARGADARARSRPSPRSRRPPASGVRIGCFRPPSTPDGISRLRLTAHAAPRRRRARPCASGARRPAVSVLVVTGTDTGVGKTVVDGGPRRDAALAAAAGSRS